MDLRRALASSLTLALVPLTTGCPSTWNCHPDMEDFSVDAEVTAAQMDTLATEGFPGQDSWETLECETVCGDAYSQSKGWSSGEVTTCELTLPQVGEGESEAEVPGRVTCEGEGFEYFCKGRRPLGYAEPGPEAFGAGDELGRALAAMAALEAASVLAFEELAAQLESWAAPAQLVARCRAAAADEVRHARVLTQLARARGASVPRGRAAAPKTDASLFAVARHNAVEGCVGEAFAALLASTFAARGRSVELRRAFEAIAVDEARHGQLAWDLSDWFAAQLGPEQAQRVDAARAQAMAALPGRARRNAGLPAAFGGLPEATFDALARAFVAELDEQLAA